jgi:hypothetical protein
LITGRFDDTTCFHCGVRLCEWGPTDDAWREHARWSPFCMYVYTIRGGAFLRRCIMNFG